MGTGEHFNILTIKGKSTGDSGQVVANSTLQGKTDITQQVNNTFANSFTYFVQLMP